MGLVGGQLAVLRRSRSLRLLALSTLGSSLGTFIAVVALTVDVQQRTHSGVWVSALNIADFLPAVAIGLALGPLLDRLSRRWLMVGADLARFAVFCALPFATSATQIVVLAAVVGFATGLFRPAVYAGIPNLVDTEELAAANSLVQGIENVAWTIGPVLGGVIAATAGTHLAYWINAATFVVSAGLIAGIPGGLLQTAAAYSKGHWQDIGEGLAAAWRSRPVLAVLVAWSIVMTALAGINVGEIFLAKDALGAGDFGFGLLFGAIGLGLALGSVGAASVLARRSIGAVYTAGIALMAVGFGAAAAAPSVWVAAAACVVAGAGNGAAAVCNATLVQRGTPDRLRGRVFTIVMSANYLCFAPGMIVAGLVENTFGPRWLWGGAAALLAVAAVVARALARGVSIDEQAQDAAPAGGLGDPALQATEPAL